MRFPGDEQEVAEPSHRCVGRLGSTERGHLAFFDQDVVERQHELAVHPAASSRDRAVRQRRCRRAPSPGRSPRGCAGGTSRGPRRGTARDKRSPLRPGSAAASHASHRSGSRAAVHASGRSPPGRRRYARRPESRSLRERAGSARESTRCSRACARCRLRAACAPGRSSAGAHRRRRARRFRSGKRSGVRSSQLGRCRSRCSFRWSGTQRSAAPPALLAERRPVARRDPTTRPAGFQPRPVGWLASELETRKERDPGLDDIPPRPGVDAGCA